MHGPPLGIDHRGIAKDELRDLLPGADLGVPQGLHLSGDLVGVPDVVLIGQQDIFGPDLPCLLQKPSKVPYCAQSPAIVLGDDDPSVPLGSLVQDLPRGIAAAVVPDEQGPVGMRLGLNALQQLGQVGFALIRGQEDIAADWGHGSHCNGLLRDFGVRWQALTLQIVPSVSFAKRLEYLQS